MTIDSTGDVHNATRLMPMCDYVARSPFGPSSQTVRSMINLIASNVYFVGTAQLLVDIAQCVIR